MKSFVSFLLLFVAAVVQATSSTGSRLLVVLDDAAEKADFSKFFGDLAGRKFANTAFYGVLGIGMLTSF